MNDEDDEFLDLFEDEIQYVHCPILTDTCLSRNWLLIFWEQLVSRLDVLITANEVEDTSIPNRDQSVSWQDEHHAHDKNKEGALLA